VHQPLHGSLLKSAGQNRGGFIFVQRFRLVQDLSQFLNENVAEGDQESFYYQHFIAHPTSYQTLTSDKIEDRKSEKAGFSRWVLIYTGIAVGDFLLVLV